MTSPGATMSQQPSGGLTFPIKLRCASAADLMSEPGLEAALSRALGRAFARARAALPVAAGAWQRRGVAGAPPRRPRSLRRGRDGLACARAGRCRGRGESAVDFDGRNPDACAGRSSRDRTDVEPVSSRGAERFGRERFEAELRTCNVPSYGGGTVDVPVAGQTPERLKEQWQSAVEAWEETSKELPSAEQRARARPIFILLRLGTPLQFAVAAELDRFIDRCIQDGDNEDATLKWFSEAILLTEGAAFPKTWAWNVQKEFRFSTDLNGLERAIQSARSDVIGLSTYLSDDVWDHGLPLSLDEASTLTSGKLERMVLNSEAAKAPKKNTVITRYTQALLRLARAIAHHRLVHWYNWQIDVTIEHIRNGDQIVDQDEHDRLKAQQKGFALRRQAFEDAASSSSNTSKQVNAILFSYPDKFDRLNFTDWPGDEVQALRKSIADVDARIAQHGGLSGIAPVLPAAGLLPGIWRAAVWASERGYYGDVAVDVFEAIKQNPVESLAKLVAIIIAGEIPGLNIAVGLCAGNRVRHRCGESGFRLGRRADGSRHRTIRGADGARFGAAGADTGRHRGRHGPLGGDVGGRQRDESGVTQGDQNARGLAQGREVRQDARRQRGNARGAVAIQSKCRAGQTDPRQETRARAPTATTEAAGRARDCTDTRVVSPARTRSQDDPRRQSDHAAAPRTPRIGRF